TKWGRGPWSRCGATPMVMGQPFGKKRTLCPVGFSDRRKARDQQEESMQSVLQLRFGAVASAVPGQCGSNGPIDRRRFMMAVAATAFVVRPAFARDDFPAHAITIINAFPPGGLNDILTRPL